METATVGLFGPFDLDASLISNDELTIYSRYLEKQLFQDNINLCAVLPSIPVSPYPSYGPLATFSTLLSYCPRPWPVLELQLAFAKCWGQLPRLAKSGKAPPPAQQLVERALVQCKQSYSSLLDLLYISSALPAIIDPGTGKSICHNALASCIRRFGYTIATHLKQEKPIVAISLPNGPLLALSTAATATFCTASPLAHGSGVGPEQFKADVLQSGASMVLASAGDVSRLRLRDAWLAEANIEVVLIELTDSMELATITLDGTPTPRSDTPCLQPNRADDIAILLSTSGTSGTKKLVPLSLHSLVTGVAMVVDSWALTPASCCLNQMPLNHVGGLVRNLFAPIFSGGSVICCSAFDANFFWDCVEDYAPTWYYASPSMHQCILEAGEERKEAMSKNQISLVCNAAGGLLPSLALQLRDTFGCTVLPSYGMTECMPISTPPTGYCLDRPGTSGISVGPEISVLDVNNDPLQAGETGHIAVRGLPLFNGYLRGSSIEKSCFTEDGWFDTGDMGYLDVDGYLYITGRSKEVINRGGELISPFEVEEAVLSSSSDPASPTYGRISKALAFSVPHDVLQEVVGICVVSLDNHKRTSLRDIQLALKDILAQVKIPALIVFMDGGLPTNNNKVLRIKLAERMGLYEIDDKTSLSDRHYEAACPSPNTPLSVSIQCERVQINLADLFDVCKNVLSDSALYELYCPDPILNPKLYLAPKFFGGGRVLPNSDWLLRELKEKVHSYQAPSTAQVRERPFARTTSGEIDNAALEYPSHSSVSQPGMASLSESQTATAMIFSDVLDIPVNELSQDSDFFVLGGDSMKAGRLLAKLRKEFKTRITIDALFASRTIIALVGLLEDQSVDGKPPAKQIEGSTLYEDLLPGCEKTCSSTNVLLLFVQLLPMCLLYPMRRALTWTVFMYCLSWSLGLAASGTVIGRLIVLVLSLFIARTTTGIVAPILTIAFKWAVIGKYREGLYPMWGRYHTRWWLVQKGIQIAGMGLFGHTNWSRCVYYRALGANIGKNVTLNKGATLGEYDLLTIRDGATLERCTVRPFAAERNTSMYLGKVSIGRNASVGLASIVAAGTEILADAAVGPNSSSWEAADADEANRDLASSRIPGAHWLLTVLLGLPIQGVATLVGALPWLIVLAVLVYQEPAFSYADPLRSVVVWFASPQRVSLHYGALAANAALGPLFLFIAVLTVKKVFNLCCGPTPWGNPSVSGMTNFRRQIIRTLMPAPRLHKLTDLFGGHYEATSTFMRAMGAKVGKRVYWPGTGPSIQDYDLIDVGNDVVFGSRSHLVTSDGIGSEPIRIKDGAMVADRVVLLPGVTLGEKTIMGSGALTERAMQYPDGSTFVGSKKGACVSLSSPASTGSSLLAPPSIAPSFNSSSTALAPKHNALYADLTSIERAGSYSGTLKVPGVRNEEMPSARSSITLHRSEEYNLTDKHDPTISPFGRAFYHKQAPYRVWNQFQIFLYSTLITIATVTYWNIGSISGVQIIARIFNSGHSSLASLSLTPNAIARPIAFYFIFLLWTIAISTIQSLSVLAFLIATKWLLMGRRKPGNYSWDSSSYCQRWQLYLKLESLRRHCYGGHGILGLLTGTHWIVLYFRALGANIGKDCALFAGGLPSLLFTEPDLLTLGDRVAVDDASLVAHINTRGKFDLNPLSVGDRSVLRSASRLLSGARMEEDSCLLEHTLVMAGDVVEARCTMQGWPAEEFKGERTPTLKKRLGWTT